MTARDLVLASTSRYRRQLLERLGLPFRALAPACDEEALKDPALSPQALAEMLALAKARSLTAGLPAATIIGSDQVAAVHLDDSWRILGKPGSAARAVEQLALLAGREHVLITAMAVLDRGQVHTHTDVTRLHMRPLERAQLERYVAADQPLDCAGAYKLEARGITLFADIISADHSAITGLPLIALTAILARCGYVMP
ncbi:MAG: septum formation protein Maf [Planctomycetes bacterium]|nr:septum formation protein Maf [Planctomycetota bacterium]